MISKKKKYELLEAISNIFCKLQADKKFENNPETWAEKEKIEFDTITEVERKISSKIKEIINSWN